MRGDVRCGLLRERLGWGVNVRRCWGEHLLLAVGGLWLDGLRRTICRGAIDCGDSGSLDRTLKRGWLPCRACPVLLTALVTKTDGTVCVIIDGLGEDRHWLLLLLSSAVLDVLVLIT